MVLIGPSGSGKSSLLNIVAGNLTHYTGDVHIDAHPIDYKKHHIGFVAQNFGLLPWKTVYQNVLLPLKIKKQPLPTYEARINDILTQLGIAELKNRYPHQLSGGQMQRVSLAKALVMPLDLLLLDEPFSALDAITRERANGLFLKVWQALQPTTLLVTHSIEEAVYLGQKIVILSQQGKILEAFDNAAFGLENPRAQMAFVQMSQRIRRVIQTWEDHDET